MKRIILDTNFLLIPAQFKVDIFTEIDRIMLEKYELFVLDKTFQELEKIMNDKNQSLKNRNAAKLAVQIIQAKKINQINTEEGHVDDLIVELAGSDTIIATQDIRLKDRLKNKSKIITLREKKKLILI